MIEIIPNWHPILVHFTIGLLITAVGLYLLSALLKNHPWREQWLSVANWNLWLGSGITLLTIVAGIYAYNTVAHDTPSHEAMTEHRNWAIATVVVIFALAVWSIFRFRARKQPHVPFLIVAVLAGGLVMVTGWHGAEAVYRYGLGVISLPQSEGEGHAHEHADGEGHDEKLPEGGEDESHGHGEEEADDHHSAAVEESPHAESESDGHQHVEDDVKGEEPGEVHTHADGTVERH